MPKRGKPDSYWEAIMKQYAAGVYHFTVGKTPGSRKWKDIIKKIDKCPLHKRAATTDLFGNKVTCRCSYHKSEPSHSTVTTNTSSAPSLSSPQPTVSRLPLSMSRPPSTSPSFSDQPSTLCQPFLMSPSVSGPPSPRSRPPPTVSRPPPTMSRPPPALSGPPPAVSRPPPTLSRPPSAVSRPPPPVSRPPPTLSRLPPTLSHPPSSPSLSGLPSTLCHPSLMSPSVSSTTASDSPAVKCNIQCSLCNMFIEVNDFHEHLGDYHAEITCQQCQKVVKGGELALTHHIETEHRQAASSSLTSVVHLRSTTPSVSSSPSTLSHPSPSLSHPPSTVPSLSRPPPTVPSVTGTPSTLRHPSSTSPSVSSPPPSVSRPPPSVSRPPPTVSRPPPNLSHLPSTSPSLSTPPSTLCHPPFTSTSVSGPQPNPSKESPTAASVESHSAHLSSVSTDTERHSFLPKQYRTVMHEGDWDWVAKTLYNSNGTLKDKFEDNWHEPPPPPKVGTDPPNPPCYFRKRLFLWAPRRMWGIPLLCPTCKIELSHGGLYSKARDVIDLNWRYYMVGECLRCSKCRQPQCPWKTDLLDQMSPAQRLKFPAILTQRLALDKGVITLMKPRTMGNTSTYIQQAIDEIHSAEWAKRVVQYLSDCELHRRGCVLLGKPTPVYQHPPQYPSLPLASWFETVHGNEVMQNLTGMRGIITSVFGRILKIDSTKKITTKLAGTIENSSKWMTNVANERGEILNSVLTTAEGAALDSLGQGIVKRYQNANEEPPQLIYVDRDCCSASGITPVLKWFSPWQCHVRLDIWHWMRRFNAGLTTEHHPLYKIWCSRLSSCIFKWDSEDLAAYEKAKRAEIKKQSGREPTQKLLKDSFRIDEMARYCRRTTRGAQVTGKLVDQLIKSMWRATDSTGMSLINPETMPRVWEVQQKHLSCIQDVPGLQLYTQVGTVRKGDQTLKEFRCARGSTSLESFHLHQCNFIPGYRANAVHTQMYLLEGMSRWNVNRYQQAVDVASSGTRLYDQRLIANINDQSTRLLHTKLLPEYGSYGKPTDEDIGVTYLLSQSGRGDLSTGATETSCAAEEETSQLQNKVDEVEDSTVSILTELPIFDEEAQLSPYQPVNPQPDSPEADLITDIPLPPDDQASDSPDQAPDSCDQAPHSPKADPIADIPLPPEESQHGVQGNGYQAVDNLAAYLVSLDRQTTALSIAEAVEIVRLYNLLDSSDKTPPRHKLKSRMKSPSGKWRQLRKPCGSAPSKQVAERLYMVHGEAAGSPSETRVAECICLRLFKEFNEIQNRPSGVRGRKLGLPQAIVQVYSHIQQLVRDDDHIQQFANLASIVLTVNGTTVAKWMKQRQERIIPSTLVQGVPLPERISVDTDRQQSPLKRPTSHPTHGFTPLNFSEPENREGQATSKRKKVRTSTPSTPPSTTSSDIQFGPAQTWNNPIPYQYGWPGLGSWPYYYQQPYFPAWAQQPPPPPPTHAPTATSTVTPHKKPRTGYKCSKCGEAKSKESNHTQLDGLWFCPSSGESYSDWKDRIYKCNLCGLIKSKANGHLRHAKKRREWYCPSLGQTVEEWKKSLDQ